jgi:hypothetical protein
MIRLSIITASREPYHRLTAWVIRFFDITIIQFYPKDRGNSSVPVVRQGIGVYFLIVKISLNSQEFSRKTNH